jgi:hypothetical protein
MKHFNIVLSIQICVGQQQQKVCRPTEFMSDDKTIRVLCKQPITRVYGGAALNQKKHDRKQRTRLDREQGDQGSML